jgi:hypothetical protein
MKILTRSMMAVFFAMSVAACGGGDDDTNPDAPPGGPDASTGPSVSATATPTTVAAGGDVEMTFTATNFTFVDPTDPAHMTDIAGEGHYHVYLDDTSTTYLIFGFDGQDTVNIPAGTAAGAHVLKVQLQTNTHAPIAEAAVFDVPITVQ